MMEVGKEENVIIFILDWYDEAFAEDLYDHYGDVLSPLNDFTWYQNQTSLYAFTYMSVPYLLTGTKWEYDESDWDYKRRAFEQSTFLYDLADNGWTIDLYTGNDYLYEKTNDIVRNYTNDKYGKCKFWETNRFVEIISKYSMAPFFVKSEYMYDTSDISNLIKETKQYDNERGDDDFWSEFRKTGVKISDDEKKIFKFYHLRGAHDSRGDIEKEKLLMEQVINYLYELKEKGIYDSSTIIITADHGQNMSILNDTSRANGEIIQSTNPILFVKRCNEVHESLQISMAPVSHEEFIPTILKDIGLLYKGYGQSYDEIGEEERIREFILRRHDDVPYCKFEIKGDVRDEKNWSIVEY